MKNETQELGHKKLDSDTTRSNVKREHVLKCKDVIRSNITWGCTPSLFTLQGSL